MTLLQRDTKIDTQADNQAASNERSLKLALAAARTAEDNRGEDIVVLDLRGQTPVFDYFVIATGSSRRQLHAISEEIDHRLEDDLGDKRMGIEGYNESRWILLDYGSIVVHLLDAETRAYYALEELWSDAERVPLPWQKIEAAQTPADPTPSDPPSSDPSSADS
ncbi:MAG: ribosome silencing factor [Planctomycetota bacterium]